MGYGVADTGVDFEFVEPRQAHAWLKTDKAIFIDSRDPDDFKLYKVQTSYSFSANDMMFRPDKLDKGMVPRCKALAAAGKFIVVVSDAGIAGIKNRGHVSRCRHVAQYLHELGVPRESIFRLEGGLNQWKRLGLDGIYGDQRRYYAGALMTDEKEREVAKLAIVDSEASGPKSLEDEVSSLALIGPGAEIALVRGRDEGDYMVTTPTVYRVTRGEIYKKPSPESEKIIKLDWPVDRLVRTTGKLHVGASGGKWVELDSDAGEKKGWVYLEGPGFGPSSRKIISEYLTF